MKFCPEFVHSYVRNVAALVLVIFFSSFSGAYSAGIGQVSLTAVHDTHIQRGTNTDFGAATTFLVKRDGADSFGGSDRIGYLRLATNETPAVIESASLLLTFTNYSGDGTTPFMFEVFGLPDGHPNEAFDEALLNFSNATNASSSLPGSFNPAGVTSSGPPVPPESIQEVC